MNKLRYMYNAEVKQEFINSSATDNVVFARFFARISKKEKEMNKDIAQMDVEELRNLVMSLELRSERTRGHFLSLIKRYIKWAVLNSKLPNCQMAIDSVTPANTLSQDSIKNKMISSPDHLQSIIDNAMDFVAQENRSTRDSLLLWLLYLNITLEDICDLKKESMDYTNMTIHHLDKSYKVDENIIELWDKCSKFKHIEMKRGVALRGLNANEMYINVPLFENDYVFRRLDIGSVKTGNFDSNSLRHILNAISKGREYNLSSKNLNTSGRFYHIYKREVEGEILTPEVFADVFNEEYNNSSEALAKTRKWRVDYEDWKFAFGY